LHSHHRNTKGDRDCDGCGHSDGDLNAHRDHDPDSEHDQPSAAENAIADWNIRCPFWVLGHQHESPCSADAPPFGEVDASATSPGGNTYEVVLSPVVVPCDYAACTSKTTTLAVGDAAPAYAAVTFDPALNTPAKCGYSEASEVACDAIHGKEYIAVRGSGTRISTADAVVVLRAALAHLSQSGG
jgi:hypothetical protein